MQAKANLTAIALMIGAMLGFAVEDALIKLLSRGIPVGQVLIMIGLGGTLTFWALAKNAGHRVSFSILKNRWVASRTISELLGTALFVTSLALVPLVTVSAIIQMAPLIVTMAAALILREQVGPRRWVAIALGILGMLIILQPWNASFAAVSLFAVGGVVFLSLRDISTRRIPSDVNTFALATLGFGATIPAGLVLWAFDPRWGAVSFGHLAVVAGCIVIGVLAYYAITRAMRIGEVSVVTPFRYSRLVFGAAIGVAFFHETITPALLIGSAIIIATGLYTLWRERQIAQR